VSSPELPFEVVWSITPRELEWIAHAPVLAGDALLVRVRSEVVIVDPDDGAIRGRCEVDPSDSRGIFALAAGDGMVTDGRGAGRMATAAAASAAGELLWTTELGVRAAKQTGAVAGGLLYVCGQDGDGRNRLLTVAVDSGELTASVALPYGAAGCVPVGDRIVIASPAPSEGNPGLYSVGPDGGDAAALDDRAVQRLGRAGDLIMACARAGDDAWELVCFTAGDGERRWQRAVGSAACAIDGDDVACLITGVDEDRPGLLDAATGQPRWIADAPAGAVPSKAAITGDVVLFSYGHGVALYRRSSGHHIGDAFGFGDAARAAGDRLYLGGSERLICAALR
jgi:outer membrane protein assembly factor BamB